MTDTFDNEFNSAMGSIQERVAGGSKDPELSSKRQPPNWLERLRQANSLREVRDSKFSGTEKPKFWEFGKRKKQKELQAKLRQLAEADKTEINLNLESRSPAFSGLETAITNQQKTDKARTESQENNALLNVLDETRPLRPTSGLAEDIKAHQQEFIAWEKRQQQAQEKLQQSGKTKQNLETAADAADAVILAAEDQPYITQEQQDSLTTYKARERERILAHTGLQEGLKVIQPDLLNGSLTALDQKLARLAEMAGMARVGQLDSADALKTLEAQTQSIVLEKATTDKPEITIGQALKAYREQQRQIEPVTEAKTTETTTFSSQDIEARWTQYLTEAKLGTHKQQEYAKKLQEKLGIVQKEKEGQIVYELAPGSDLYQQMLAERNITVLHQEFETAMTRSGPEQALAIYHKAIQVLKVRASSIGLSAEMSKVVDAMRLEQEAARLREVNASKDKIAKLEAKRTEYQGNGDKRGFFKGWISNIARNMIGISNEAVITGIERDMVDEKARLRSLEAAAPQETNPTA